MNFHLLVCVFLVILATIAYGYDFDYEVNYFTEDDFETEDNVDFETIRFGGKRNTKRK